MLVRPVVKALHTDTVIVEKELCADREPLFAHGALHLLRCPPTNSAVATHILDRLIVDAKMADFTSFQFLLRYEFKIISVRL